MYKLFIYIFSLFILSLTTIPCADKIDVLTTEIVNNGMDHGSSSEHSDFCTPFCACNCCKTTVNFSFKKVEIQESIVDDSMDESFPFYEENLHLNEPIDIWQPPKLS